MFNEVMSYLHDNKWFSSHKMQFKTYCFVYKQSETALFNYSLLHFIDFDDVNLTISPLDRPTPAEFTKGFVNNLNNNHYFKHHSTNNRFVSTSDELNCKT